MADKRPEQKSKLDPVEEASRESFPASDSPGWIGQHGEAAADQLLDQIERLKQMASSDDLTLKARYKAIGDRRDQVLTRAMIETAQALLKASDYGSTRQAKSQQSKREAIAAMEELLSQSSVPDIDQQLLALVGTHTLFGWKVETAKEDDELRLFPSGSDELDLLIVLRLAKALDRSPEQERLLWQKIEEAMQPPDEELIKTAIRALLDERSVSELDDVEGEMIIQNVLGG